MAVFGAPGFVATYPGAGNLTGSTSGYSSAYGGIPGVPNPTATAGQAAGGNLGNLGTIENLSGGVNQFNEGQLLSQYNMAIPNYSGLTATASGQVGQELSGKLPQDVINQITQQAAERGIATGSPGSANANSAYLAALGLNSLGMTQTGFQNLGQLTQMAPKAGIFDPSSMFVTPEQQQQAQYAANVSASAPNPAEAALTAEGLASGGAGSTPWWYSAYPGSWLGPGTKNLGGVYHTPAPAQ